MPSLTDNERALLRGLRENEYDDGSFSVIENSGLSPEVARGVMTSLQGKGLIEIGEPDRQTNTDPKYTIPIYLTAKGWRACRDHEIGSLYHAQRMVEYLNEHGGVA